MRIKGVYFLLIVFLLIMLAGCGKETNKEPQGEENDKKTATLYIGQEGSEFKKYPVTYQDELTPELLVEAMSELTGWNLSLADKITTGKGGMTVCFSSDCALFIGPPDPQKDAFHMYDSESLDFTILDSIQRTLQYNFVDEGLGDPSKLDIYYCSQGDKPIQLPFLNITIPMDQPYPGSEVLLKSLGEEDN